MFTEILTADESRKIAFSKIKTQYEETYEIRLIIWSTKDVYMSDDNLNI